MRQPWFLCYNRRKVQAFINFLHELGLSGDSIGLVVTQCPEIGVCSVEDNLRPKAEYFKWLGVNVAIVLQRSPAILSGSIGGHLKPVTKFFLERGFSVEEVGTVISRYTALYSSILTQNLIPKWEFFFDNGIFKIWAG